MARIITVTSGKGGVGKTNVSLNLALYLASRGYRVCLFDADLSLANINILLNLYPEYNLEDVILKRRELKDIIIRDYEGIDIIPGSSGVEQMANLEADEINYLVGLFSALDKYDFFIFDTSAGVSKNVISFCMAATEIILVTTPEPTALTDAYALLKVLSLNGYRSSVMVVVNQSKNSNIANVVFNTLREAVQKYLPIKLLPLGVIFNDHHVTEAVKQQKPFVRLYPNCIASKSIRNIAIRLIKRDAEDFEYSDLETFWTKCLNIFKIPLKLNKKNSQPGKTEKVSAVPPKNGKGKINQPPPSTETIQNENVTKSEITAKDHPMVVESAVLNRLVDSISALTQEVRAIRKVIENQKSEPSTSDKTQSILIPLDFQGFLKRRNTN